MRWKQGEHIAIIGETGSGKTFLETKLLLMRQYVIVLRTKDDDTKFPFPRVNSVDKLLLNRSTRWELFPKHAFGDMSTQREQCHRAMLKAYHEQGWCLAVDETFYLCEKLKLTSDLDMLLTQGRGHRNSIVCAMQRPSRVTRFALSECKHVFAFGMEGRDVKEILGQSTNPRMVPVVQNLRRYEFAYYNRTTRDVQRGYAQGLEEL